MSNVQRMLNELNKSPITFSSSRFSILLNSVARDKKLRKNKKMKKKTLGNCFEVNTNKLLEMWFKDKTVSKLFYLCHGKVIGAKNSDVEGKQFIHCWIETKDGDMLFDYSNDNTIEIRKDLISKRIIENTVVRYTVKQIMKLMYKFEHYGDYTKEERKIVGLIN